MPIASYAPGLLTAWCQQDLKRRLEKAGNPRTGGHWSLLSFRCPNGYLCARDRTPARHDGSAPCTTPIFAIIVGPPREKASVPRSPFAIQADRIPFSAGR